MTSDHYIKIGKQTALVTSLIGTGIFILYLSISACNGQQPEPAPSKAKAAFETPASYIPVDTKHKTIHIFVALCDNQYQGIVPVPAKIGNGQDPDNNLYWGCGYGSVAQNAAQWKLKA